MSRLCTSKLRQSNPLVGSAVTTFPRGPTFLRCLGKRVPPFCSDSYSEPLGDVRTSGSLRFNRCLWDLGEIAQSCKKYVSLPEVTQPGRTIFLTIRVSDPHRVGL